jgi:serine/threonine protein kinase
VAHNRPPEIAGYHLLRVVGRGAFGEVWLAQDRLLGLYRAIKVVRLPEGMESEMRSGERLLRGLNQYLRRCPPGRTPGIAVYEAKIDPDGRFFYYVMPLADDASTGREIDPTSPDLERYRPLTLRALLQSDDAPGHLDAGRAISIFAELAEGLAHLHDAGLAHCDIKPSNIVFVGRVPMLADIDLVRPADATLSVAGTPGYAPPEQPGRPSGDLYSLAMSLYVAVTGQAPNPNLLLPGDWSRRPDLPRLRELNEVWLKGCDPDPAKRHASVRELRDDLRLIELGRGIRWRRVARNAMRVATVVAVLLVVAVAFGLRERRRNSEKDFALYQSALERVALNYERGRLGGARKILEEEVKQKETLEARFIRSQSRGDQILEVALPPQEFTRIEFSPDGQHLAVEGDEEIHVVRVVDGARAGQLRKASSLIGWVDNKTIAGSVSVTNDNRRLMTWGLDGRNTNQLIQTGNQRGIRTFWDRRTIAFFDRERPWQMAILEDPPRGVPQWQPIWDADSPKHSKSDLPEDPIPDFRFLSADGSRLLMAFQKIPDDASTGVWMMDVGHGRSVAHRNLTRIYAKGVAMSEDGSQVAIAAPEGGILTVLEGFTLATQWSWKLGDVIAVAFRRDGSLLAAGDGEGRVHVLDPRDFCKPEQVLSGHSEEKIGAVGWSSDGTRLASVVPSGQLLVWAMGAETTAQSDVRAGFKSGIGKGALVFDAAGTQVAVPGESNVVRILDCRSLAPVETLTAMRHPLWIGSNEAWGIGTEGDRDFLVEIDRSSGRIRSSRPIQGVEGRCHGVASKDGKAFLLYDDGGVAVVQMKAGGESISLRKIAHSYPIREAVFSEKLQQFAVVVDKQVELWPMESGSNTVLFSSGTGCNSATFLKDGTCLVVGQGDTVTSISPQGVRSSFKGPFAEVSSVVAFEEHDRIALAGSKSRMALMRLSDGVGLPTFTHRGLSRNPGSHQVRCVARIPHSDDLLGLTLEGELVRWRADLR